MDKHHKNNKNHKNNGRRLFLALWPDENVREQLVVQQQRLRHKSMAKAKPVARENLHLTLHFLGTVAEQVIPQLITSLDSVQAPDFELNIDRWGYFSKARLLWLGSDDEPPELAQLLKASKKTIAGCVHGYSQKKFIPHVTLFRKARPAMELALEQSIAWPVQDFVLVESDTRAEGVEYRILERWPLQ